MKLLIVSVIAALIAAASANPIQVSDNNVGDIITVGVNAKLSIDSTVNQDIVSVLFLLLNNQTIDVDLFNQIRDLLPLIDTSKVPPQLLTQLRDNMTPEMMERAKSLLTRENVEKFATMLKQQ